MRRQLIEEFAQPLKIREGNKLMRQERKQWTTTFSLARAILGAPSLPRVGRWMVHVSMALATLTSVRVVHAIQTFTTNPGWTSSNTNTNSYNFGYSASTSVAGGATGEAGGVFTRREDGTDLDRYHADTNLADLNGASAGDVDLSIAISASGKFDMAAVTTGWADNSGDTGLYLGHMSSSAADLSFIGFALRESGSGSPTALRIRALARYSDGSFVVGADSVFDPGDGPDVNHIFSYTYNPVTDILDVLIDGNSLGPMLVAEFATAFDGFGMGVYPGQNSDTGNPAGRTAQFFIDDVTYTGIQEVPEPGTAVLCGIGLMGMVAARRRRRRS